MLELAMKLGDWLRVVAHPQDGLNVGGRDKQVEGYDA